MTYNNLIIATMLSVLPTTSFAQYTPHTSMWLNTGDVKSLPVPFLTNADINQYNIPAVPIEWGMDTAWNWDVNVRRGTNFVGKDILSKGVGRVSFQPSDLVDANGNLSAAQQSALQSRLNNMMITGTRTINLNCDHEVLMNKDAYPNAATNYANYCGKPEEWYKVIKATVKYCRSKGFTVVSVSPFNEPDYGWSQYKYNGGTPSDTYQRTNGYADFKEIARLICEDPELAGIRICGGNTLNCDKALGWYNGIKPYIHEGNTHQLAGSMTNYINFWKTVKSDGNRATADELHNTMEAFIGVHYGMDAGIWWGMDAGTRGEYCRATALGGKEIGYTENNSAWSAATVYKRPDGRVDAFLGVSERQAKTSSFDITSKDRLVYYNGYGPVYSYTQELPADPTGAYGSDYQKNAERMIQITYGEDVPLEEITAGEYAIMNANSKKVIAYNTSSTGFQYAIQKNYNAYPNDEHRWIVEPIASNSGGDFGYFRLRSYKDNTCMLDILNGSTSQGGSFISYRGGGDALEQFFLEYAGNNFWYIRNRHSGLYLQVRNASISASAYIEQGAFTGAQNQKWRFIPVATPRENTGKLELDAPAVPQGLAATVQGASVKLSWTANTDADLSGYNVIRQDETTGDCDMIGRIVTGTEFIDNDVVPGRSYTYKIKSVDRTRNQSAASAPVKVSMEPRKGRVAHYSFDADAKDDTENLMDGITTGNVKFNAPTIGVKEGSKALYFDGSTGYAMLPTSLGNMRQMTIATWVNCTNTSTSWTRIFDFGNGTDQYMFLTPSNGSNMRFVMKNGGEEQVLSTAKISSGWKHLAVTISDDAVTLYLNGEAVATSTTMTIRPSDFRPKRNFLGRSQFAADPLLRGYIDDFQVYNYPLSAKEVELVMNGGVPVTGLLGDANGDGSVTVADAELVANYYLGLPSEGIVLDNSDVNGDGKVTIEDANMIVNIAK